MEVRTNLSTPIRGVASATRMALRLVAVLTAVAVTFLLWFAYAIVAVEGHDSRPVLRLAWWLGAGASLMAVVLCVKPAKGSRRVTVAYVSIAAALLASWGMLRNEGRTWGTWELGMACAAVVSLTVSIAAAVPPVVRKWLGDGPYASRPSGHDA
jgi:hypothetical protein